ncbi:MADD-like protein, partial [Mya arenaria]
ITPPSQPGNNELPPMPEPEGSALRNHLKQALTSMSMTPQPIKNLDVLAQNPDMWKRRESFSNNTGFNPLIYGNDVDSVDIATRVAMAVEFFAEWALCPQNVAFLRVQTSVFDPLLIGDKPKWYASQLQPILFNVYDDNSSLGAALSSASEVASDENPTDESGSDSDGAESTSSSYSSLSDFVTDMVNSEIDGTGHSDSANSQNDESDDGADSSDSSDDSSAPRYAPDESSVSVSNPNMPSSKEFRRDSGGSNSPPPRPSRPPLQPLNKSINSAFESYEKPPSPRERVPPHSPRERIPSGSGSRGTPSPREWPPPNPLAIARQHREPSDSSHERPPLSPREWPPPNPLAVARQHREPTSPREPPSPRMPRVPPPSPSLGRERFGSTGSQGSSTDSTKGSNSGSARKGNTLHPNRPGLKTMQSDPTDTKPGSLHAPPEGRGSSPSSLISTLSNDLTDFAHNASSTLSEFFGAKNPTSPSQTPTAVTPASVPTPQTHVKPAPKPFAPLGNRKALVEKSGLVKHATNRKPKTAEKQKAETKGSSNSENQQFLKEVVASVLEGQGISWLKMGRVKKLLEDENYRNFMVSRLNKNLDKKLSDDDTHIEDVPVTKPVYKGMLSLLKAFVHGLETTFQNYGIGGMASAYMVLEIAHTHHWARERTSSSKSDTSITPELNSPYGSQESLSIKGDHSPRNPDSQSLNEEHTVAALGYFGKANSSQLLPNGIKSGQSPDSTQQLEMVGSSLEEHPYKLNPGHTVKGPDMNRNIPSGQKCDIIITGSADESRHQHHPLQQLHHQHSGPTHLSSPSSDRDVMLEFVKNKGLMKSHLDQRVSSIDSDGKASVKKGRSSSLYSNKSSLSTGSRYRDGQMISTSPIPGSPEVTKTYLFEGLIGKERSRLWDQMQFWEDVYLDAVAQERDIIGMDQGPADMMDRYNSLGPGDRKRLEHDEDRLLSVLLYNLVSFMIMTRIHKTEIKKKIRRLLGKSHIGLAYSQEINNLLDKIETLHGNDIDLRPMGSRFMQKQSFTVHWGSDNKGDMLFMEVCDDCIILRSVTGSICDRWWYEKLVNMTYCPKTKVLCLWRKMGDKVQLNQFYTKKCRELYFCVKEAMEKAAMRNNSKIPGPELGGEFPVQDVKSGQGGLLQVCMEGIGLLLANSKSFIELNRIKKCFTLKGEIFILEEFDAKSKQVIQHRFKSRLADQICYAVLCVFSYVAAGNELREHQRKQT